MSLTAVKTMDLSIHGTAGTLTNSVLATDAVTDVKVATGANIAWSKINKTGSSLADLTTRSAGDLTSGTLSDSRLSANVALLDANQTFTGTIGLAGTVTVTAGFSQTGANTFSTGTGAVSLNGNTTMAAGKTLTLSGDPTTALQAATKQYVDGLVQGLDVKGSVRVATTTALPANTPTGTVLTADSNGALPSIDGVTLVVADRVLVKNEAASENNGIYTVTAVGDGSNPFVLTRATDADISAEVTTGMFTFVEEGSTLATTGWVLSTANPITLGTTGLTFTQFSSAGVVLAGAALAFSGNTLNVQVDNSTIAITGNQLVVKTGGITNTQVSASAAIAYSKLNLSGSIVNADVASGAAIAWSKIDKTGSSLADLATRAASDLTVTATGNLTSTTGQTAFVELQGNLDNLATNTGTSIDNNTITYSSTNFVANNDSLKVAIGKLDTALETEVAKTIYSSFIYNATGGETTLAKPGGAPAIPDDENTEVYIDGRKVFRGSSYEYTVDGGGGGITFYALAANQSLELRYRA